MASSARNLEIRVDSGDALDVRRFTVRERMSALFDVEVIALSDNADIDFDAVVGLPASFLAHTPGGSSRVWTGICRHIQQVAAEETGLSTYHVHIVPTLWLATQRRNHRMFQQMSELDIVKKLLGEWGIAPELLVTQTYKTRKYRVQYAETDYAFLCRMLEDAGISFHFRQGEGGTNLVLSDAPQRSDPRAGALWFADNPARAMGREYATKVHIGQRVRPGRYTLRDHDTRLPASYPLLATAEAPGAGVEGQLESFHYVPGAFLFGTDQGEDTPHADDKGKTRSDEKEGRALAGKRLEAKRADAKVTTFETNAADLAPGVVMSIVHHPRSDLENKPLLVVESTIEGTSDGEWTHRCEARRGDIPFRPPLSTPKPRISGVESATVVGPSGQEIHTDEFGRIRVHFHWDRESKMDDNSSCWLHVSQPWGGAGYGGSNLPRVGQEVLVDFLGGDPDRPVITGRLYTNQQKTPYKLPDNKTQSGWKSNSSPSTGGYNELMFEDSAGKELLRMQAEKDLHKLVKNDENVTIGRDRSKLVKNDDAFTVGNNRTKRVENDEHVNIGNDRRKRIDNDEHVSIGNDRHKHVENDEHVNIGNDHRRKVANDEHVSIGNDHTRQVSQNEMVTIGQDLMHTVMSNVREAIGLSRSTSVGMHRSTQVGMIDSTIVGQTHMVMVSPAGEDGPAEVTSCTMDDNKITTKCAGGATIVMLNNAITLDANQPATNSATIKMDADKLELDMNGNATVTLSNNKITLATGGAGPQATVTLEGTKITISAETIAITGTKTVDIHGKPINLNCDPPRTP